MRELQGRMRHLQQSIGPPIGPDGRPMGPPMMMGPNGPMARPPPNHPIMMEMQALDKHLRGLYQQPQNPDTQQQVIKMESYCLHILKSATNYFAFIYPFTSQILNKSYF